MHRKVTSVASKLMTLTCSVMLASAFFNRWLVVDVPPGWQLVSQVLLALRITLLQGESLVVLAGSAVLSRCIILFTKSHVPNFIPAWLQVSQKKQLPLFSVFISSAPPISAIIYHQHYLPLSPFPHFVSPPLSLSAS